MNKPMNPNWIAGVLAVFTLLVLGIVGLSLQEDTSTAQENLAEDTLPDVEYVLKTGMSDEAPMAFIGVGGEIDGVTNPTLTAQAGQTVKITVINEHGIMHDLTIDVFDVTTGALVAQDERGSVTFTADKAGEFKYFCSVPGHEQVGMVGTLLVEGTSDEAEAPITPNVEEADVAAAQPAAPDAVSVVRHPSDLPAPLEDREPTHVEVNLTAVEVVGQLADGTTYTYFTFDGLVPGPMIRVREGDTVELNLTNADGSQFAHSIDLHAVTGPGGGAVYTQINPGETASFTFKALQPGLYVYHCATPSVAHHIGNGMYGMILVEPEGGLPPVDREFYVMQGEVYTAQPFGTRGHLDFSHEHMLDEAPEYFVFNGAAEALTSDENALRANVGETVRIYFGVGGPNFTSSFHVIGEILDRVYQQASLTSDPLTDVQTTLVPPGGAAVIELTLEVPGRYILVDHALSRAERGLSAYLYVEGEENPVIFDSAAEPMDAGH